MSERLNTGDKRATYDDQWERYWIGGYTTEQGGDTIVNRYGRTEAAAAKEAKSMAADVARQLSDLGVGLTVTVWTQVWRVRRQEQHEPRAVVDEIAAERQTEPRQVQTMSEATS